jgi:hypothetical protein
VPKNQQAKPSGISYNSLVSNFLNYIKPTSQRLNTIQVDISEQNYRNSLEAFVQIMDKSALESIVDFVQNLRQPLKTAKEQPMSKPIGVSIDLLSQIQSPDLNNVNEQSSIAISLLEDISTLANEGYDMTFLEHIEPSLKERVQNGSKSKKTAVVQPYIADAEERYFPFYIAIFNYIQRPVHTRTTGSKLSNVVFSSNISV